MRKGLLVTTIAVLLALAGAAQAQTVELEASGPPEDQTLTAGDSVDLSFTATLTVEDTACQESVEVPGNATASLQPDRDGVEASMDPLSFTLEGDDTHVSALDDYTYEDESSGTVTIETSGGVTEDYQIDVGLFAETDAVEFGDMEGCEDDLPAATSNSLTVTLDVQADEEPEEDEGEDDGNQTDPDDGDGTTDGGAGDPESPEEDGIPAPAALAPVAAVLAAALRRGGKA